MRSNACSAGLLGERSAPVLTSIVRLDRGIETTGASRAARNAGRDGREQAAYGFHRRIVKTWAHLGSGCFPLLS
jgi:hypothetical protein